MACPTAVPVNNYLAMANIEVRCPYVLGVSMSNKAGLFGHKRMRDANAPGPCMLVAGLIRATINLNFTMAGTYAPVNSGVNRDSLRENNFYSVSPVGDWQNQLFKLLEKGYHVQKDTRAF